MIENKDILIFLGPLFGIGIGWLLNHADQWFKARQEDKRKLKEVLYNLLETYHLFIRSDFDRYIKLISNKVFQRLPKEHQTAEVDIFLNQLYSNMINNFLKPDLINDNKKIEKSYQDSIKLLSSVDPFLAYKLGGKTAIIKFFEHFDNYIKELNENLIKTYPSDTEGIQGSFKIIGDIIKPDIINEAIKILEEDIYKVAFEINLVVWLKSRRILSKIKRRITIEVDKKLDEMIDKYEKSCKIKV